MKILFIASEAFPFAKVGGLADVTSSLALALHDLGHECYVMLPAYESIKTRTEEIQGVDVDLSFMGHQEQAVFRTARLRDKVSVYLAQNDAYFGTDEIYAQGELERFFFLAVIVPAAISRLGIHPDVVHCHDWHAALVPLFLRQANLSLPCVFTIHNLAYQGLFDQQFSDRSGLSSVWQQYAPPGSPRLPLNFMSQGILLADTLTTVSPTYASEILTPEYGDGLEWLLDYRRNDLYGIINGIDYDEYDPATDSSLETNYNSTTIERKVDNKLALQERSRLPQNPEVPLFGMVSRLDEQKGIDLVVGGVDDFFGETNAQLVILGQGREHYAKSLIEAASRHSGRLSVTIATDEQLARLVYAGSDMFLMPSRFEPCGLGQLIAMRYGTVPVVRHTGGLADTVKDVVEADGNGFVFQNYSVPEMVEAIKRAEAGFYRRDEWRSLVKHNMKLDFSWRTSARKYEEVYRRAQSAHRSRGA